MGTFSLKIGTSAALLHGDRWKPHGKAFYPKTTGIMPFDSTDPVKVSTISAAAQMLGASLRQARRSRGITQEAFASAAGINIATARGLEKGVGTVGTLLAVLGVLEHRFSNQPPGDELGTWLARVRKQAGYSQQSFAARIGVSKPTIIQIERGRGNLKSLLGAMSALGLATTVVPLSDPLHGARLILGDCLAVMPMLPDQSVDTIITDLPYASGELAWDQAIPLQPLWEHFRRLLKPNGAVILTASQPFTTRLIASNPDWFKYSMVWIKTRPTGFLHAKHMPLKKHEDICIFSPAVLVDKHRSKRAMIYNPQGLTPLNNPTRQPNGLTHGTFMGRKIGNSTVQTHTNYPTSILRFASETKPVHETQKPLDLMRYLVRTFSNEGDAILDCCFGSGTTGVAAVMEGRKFVGIEKDERYFLIARERLMRTASAT